MTGRLSPATHELVVESRSKRRDGQAADRRRARPPRARPESLSFPSLRPRTLFGALLAVGLTSAVARAQPDGDGPDLSHLKGEAKARIQNIEQALTDWDIEGAKREVLELEKLVPPDIEPLWYFRGRVAFEEGRYDEAVAALEKAKVSEGPGSWLRLVKDTQAVVGGHQKAESAHFVFLYPKGKDAVLVPYALDTLERIRAALEQDLGPVPTEKVRVELVSSAAELSRTSTLSKEAIRTTGTIAICKFNKLIVTSPKALIHGYDWLDTIAHEYTHLVVARRSRNTVPIWLHEGLAKYLESRWRGPAGGAMTPSTLALLGDRVRKNTLVPFAKMHPSMALLPTAEDAATAFAEVFFAVQLIHREGGNTALAQLLEAMAKGANDKQAVESTLKRRWADFERSWMAHLKKQPFPKELVPTSAHEKKELSENAPGKAKKERNERRIAFGDFAEISEPEARRRAHLGELFRERGRMRAAVEQYARAHRQVGDRYESVSNKFAITLLELKRLDEAQAVLEGCLTMHPGSVQTNVTLGRLSVRKKAFPRAKVAALEAMAVNPFDPQVHLILFTAAKALGEEGAANRALEALRVLEDLSPERVAELSTRLGHFDDLTSPPPPQRVPDAG